VNKVTFVIALHPPLSLHDIRTVNRTSESVWVPYRHRKPYCKN